MAYQAVAGEQRIWYEYLPSGTATVVLVHGWGMSGRVWDSTVAALLDAGIGVIRYDQRCCGRSDREFADVSIEALGADLAALCEQLAPPAPILNGWSLGGAVVVDAAARMGSSVAGLVLTCGATPRYTRAGDFPFGGTVDDVAATVAALRADRPTFLRNLYYQGVFARDVGDGIRERCVRIALQASSGADASLAALADLDQRSLLPTIAVPVLVVLGARDGVVAPDIGRFAAQQLPDAELLELPDCGHAPFLEDPQTYHDALLRFVDRCQVRRRS
jgi:pimeloyl-[acyl-carrier protein] methyl ester esterase